MDRQRAGGRDSHLDFAAHHLQGLRIDFFAALFGGRVPGGVAGKASVASAANDMAGCRSERFKSANAALPETRDPNAFLVLPRGLMRRIPVMTTRREDFMRQMKRGLWAGKKMGHNPGKLPS